MVWCDNGVNINEIFMNLLKLYAHVLRMAAVEKHVTV